MNNIASAFVNKLQLTGKLPDSLIDVELAARTYQDLKEKGEEFD
jgi:hypothetical protein